MRSILLFCLTLTLHFASAQELWEFTHLTPDQGLSTGTANCVFKDSRGFLWIGTVDGLNRYDGYEVTIFKNNKKASSSLAGNFITAISEDKTGNIWIGTRSNGISIYDWKTGDFQSFSTYSKSVLPTGEVRNLLSISENRMLIGILDGGLAIFNSESRALEVFNTTGEAKKSTTNDAIFSIISGATDEYWISNKSNTIDIFNTKTKTFRRLKYSEGSIISEASRKPILLQKEFLWIGTDGNGLIRFDSKNQQTKNFTKENSGLNSNIITSLFQSGNSLYVGTDGNGINVIDLNSNRFSYMQSSLLDNKSLSSDAIYDIYKDDAGVIWVATFRGGVNSYSATRSKFKHYKQVPYESNSLSFASVIEVMEARDGKIWIGTDGGGIDVLDPKTGKFEHYTHNPRIRSSMSTNVAISMLEDTNGYIWVGTYAGGVNRFNPRTKRFKRYLPDAKDKESINGRNVWSIDQDSQGAIWFGLLNGGIDRYDPKNDRFIHYQADGKKGSLSSNLVLLLYEDSQNNYWVGTENTGLDLFDRASGTFKNFRNKEGDSTTILHNNVRTLFEDSTGQLWIGTAGGASIMDLKTKQIKPAKVNKLLPNLVINGILEDAGKNLWISTNKGLSKYNRATETIQNFTKTDGLQGTEFNYGSSTLAKGGTMYFGGTNGLNAFNPSQVQKSEYEPQISITDITVLGESIFTLRTANGGLQVEQTPEALTELSLEPSQNIFEISFSALDYASPSTNKYRYQLEGFDEDWRTTTADQRTASYTNLDAGSYFFNVQGSNSDGQWSPHIATLTINIKPQWYQAAWFRTLMILLIASTAYAVYRWRNRIIDQQKAILKRRIEEETAKVSLQNENLEKEKAYLTAAVEEIHLVINKAVDEGDFSSRIEIHNKVGEWKELALSINSLFETIVTPFHEITNIVGAMASGNLSLRYKKEAQGEVLKMSSSLNYAIDTLADLIETIQTTSFAIEDVSSEMLVNSHEMSVGTSEIANSTSELSNGAQEQVARIDEASSTLENILESSSNVGEQARSINQAAENGVSLSETGQTQMEEMDKRMQQMLEVSKNTNAAITQLLEKSAQVAGIVESIQTISVETNMLALNAAIEAAKAGDAGRGFAVVADQIRQLAENSSSFTSDIAAIITEVQSSINNTNLLISEMSEDISQSVEASESASSAFTELASSYSETLNLSERIVNFTDDQYLKVRQVVQVMESVVVISEEAAAGTEEIASSAGQLSSGMDNYTVQTEGVAKVIKLLKEKVEQFRLS